MTDIKDTIGHDENQEEELYTVEETEKIGKIIVEDRVTVSLEEDDYIKAFVFIDEREKVSLGSYIQVPVVSPSDESYKNPEILMMVKSMDYINLSNSNQYSNNTRNPVSEESEYENPLLLKLEPISMVTNSKEDSQIVPKKSKNISVPPKPSSKIYISNNKKFLKTGLKIPQKGITIGKLSLNGRELPDKEDPLLFSLENPGFSINNSNNRLGGEGESVLWRHMLICGSTGTGKTHTCKNIIRQVVKSRKYEMKQGENKTRVEPNIIIIDPESEYHQMSDDPNNIDSSYYRDLERKGVKTGKVKDVKNFYADVRGVNSTDNISNKVPFSLPFGIVEEAPGLLVSFNAGEPTRRGIMSIVKNFFKENSKNKPTYQDFNNWFKNKEDDKLADKHNINDQILGAIKRRIVDENLYDNVFNSGSQSLDVIYNKIFKEGRVSIIPTGHLNTRQEKLVVMGIMSIVTRNKIGNPAKTMKCDQIKELPIVMAIDEAHNYINEPKSYSEKYIVNNFKDVAKRGRKYKLGLMMITQNPEDIQEDILKQANTKIYLGLDGDVLDRVNLDREMKKRIMGFEKGQMMVKTSGRRPIEVKGFRKCMTSHKS